MTTSCELGVSSKLNAAGRGASLVWLAAQPAQRLIERRLADAPLEAAEPGSRSGGGGRQIKEDLRGVEDGSGYQRDFRPVLARARALRPRE